MWIRKGIIGVSLSQLDLSAQVFRGLTLGVLFITLKTPEISVERQIEQ